MMTEKQLKERVYKLQNELRIYEEILGTKREGFGRPKGSLKYNGEQRKFLCANRNIPMNELVELFNKKFGTNYNNKSRALYNFMYREGIIIAEPRDEPHGLEVVGPFKLK